MKASDVIEALERFFLDIVGTVIPGVALIFGIAFVLNWPTEIRGVSIFPPKQNSDWILLVTVGYVIGHAVTSIGQNVLLRAIEYAAVRLRKSTWRRIAALVPDCIMTQADLFDKIEADPIFKAVADRITRLYPELEPEKKAIKVTSWRNIAMSLASDQRHTVYRFMFLSLLNLGIATVLFLFVITWVFVNLLQVAHAVSGGRPVNLWLCAILFMAGWFFLQRRYEFHGIAMRVPFPMALVGLQRETPKRSESETIVRPGQTREDSRAVYLAGGFRSGWQDRVKLAAPLFNFFDPRSHGLENEAEYTLWDLEAIRASDWILAYLEAGNPGGYALALEVGFAKALGKTIIFVDEKSGADAIAGRYLRMITECSDVSFRRLDEALEFLQKLQQVA
jgi:hypothetical protein